MTIVFKVSKKNAKPDKYAQKTKVCNLKKISVVRKSLRSLMNYSKVEGGG